MGRKSLVRRILQWIASHGRVLRFVHRTPRTIEFSSLSSLLGIASKINASPQPVTSSSHACDNRSTVPPVGPSPIGVSLRPPFRIYKVQNDGELHFVKAVQTFDDAAALVRELGEVWPGEYIIENEETVERVFINTRDERKN